MQNELLKSILDNCTFLRKYKHKLMDWDDGKLTIDITKDPTDLMKSDYIYVSTFNRVPTIYTNDFIYPFLIRIMCGGIVCSVHTDNKILLYYDYQCGHMEFELNNPLFDPLDIIRKIDDIVDSYPAATDFTELVSF